MVTPLWLGAVTQQSGHGDHGVARGVEAAAAVVAGPMFLGQGHQATHQLVLHSVSGGCKVQRRGGLVAASVVALAHRYKLHPGIPREARQGRSAA